MTIRNTFNIKKNNNLGTTMIELIITVAIVAVFFGAVVVAVPRCLEQYIMMKESSEALELTSIIENGLSTELGGAGKIHIDADRGLTYIKNKQIKYFPMAKGVTEDSNYEYELSIDTSGEEKVVKVTGKPKFYGALYDAGIYGNMTVEIILKYATAASCINTKITVFNAEGKSIAVTEKPIILYNR